MSKGGNSHDSTIAEAGAMPETGAPETDGAGDAPAQANVLDADTEQSDAAAHTLAEIRRDPAAIHRLFETGKYPYKTKLSQRAAEQHKAELQVELLKV